MPPVENELTAFIEKLAKVKTESRALNYGDYKNITIQNKNLLFERHCDHETVFVAVNAENAPCSIDARGEYKAIDFLTGETKRHPRQGGAAAVWGQIFEARIDRML